MRKYILALLVAVVSVAGAHAATFQERYPLDHAFQVAQNTSPSGTETQTSTQVAKPKYDQPTTTTTTTVVRGGTVLASVIEWLETAFGVALATMATGALYKIMSYFGIQTTQAQRDQLQSIVVNGLNDAAAKAEVSLRGDARLDVNVKNQIVSDAIAYTQDHAKDTIKALGLDANDGQAVEAIRARIATALNDPRTPTPPALTPVSAGGTA
jgi:hypothetical protein